MISLCLRTILLPALTVMLLRCDAGLDGTDRVAISGLQEKRVPLEKEWRDARRVPASERSAVELGPIPSGAYLRLGVLPAGTSTEKASAVAVFADDTKITEFTIRRDGAWQDFRLELSKFNAENKVCTLLFEGAGGDWVGPAELVTPDQQAAPNVLLFLIDTLRKDHLGAYGYSRETSPNIDGVARDGVVFENPMSQTSWTRPSVASILTGVYPHIHGANDWPDVLRDDVPRLGRTLSQGGYETQAFFVNPQVLPVWGFGSEFMRCIDVDAELGLVGEDKTVIDRVIPALQNAAGRPWFFYVHTLGPHEPYSPPEGYEKRFVKARYEGNAESVHRQEAIDLYDAEIAFTDEQFGRVIDELKALGLYDNTTIVITSDHGEEFWEHGGEFHGTSLYEELLDVPLIIKLPKQRWAGERRAALVQSIDIAPTIVEIAGVAPEPRFQGRSLVQLLADANTSPRTGFASLYYEAQSKRAAKRGDQKYIRDAVAGTETWFDLVADPREQHPIAAHNDRALARYVDYIAGSGGEGLHLLITCGDGEKHTVSVSISGEGITSADFRYYESKKEMSFDGKTVTFSMRTTDAMDAQQRRDLWHTEHAEQDNAHLLVNAVPDLPLQIQIHVDGAAAPADLVVTGKDGARRDFTNASIVPLDLLAAPDAYDPAVLPRGFGIYAWYVPAVQQLTEGELDPETRDELKALGYLE